MPETLAVTLTAIAMVVGYFALVYRLAAGVAGKLADLTAPRDRTPIVDEDTGIAIDTDEKVVNYRSVKNASGTTEMRPISRGDQRMRTWFFLVVFPVTLYLHYQFWAQLFVAYEWSLERVGDLISAWFYSGT